MIPRAVTPTLIGPQGGHMKIVRFSQNGHSPRLGCFLGQDRVADLEASCVSWLEAKGVVRAAAIASVLFPQSTRGFLDGGSATQDMLGAMVEATKAGKFQPVSHPINSVRLHAPINDPHKFICIGLNYRDHAEESGNPIPKEPPVFPKWNNAIQDPGEPILRPRGEKRFDWEVELGVVIGKTARFVPKEKALDYVYGYIIQYLSNIMTLAPGDLIATGTPAGVGFSRKPPILLQPGDVCKLEITGLGTLENPVKDA